MLMSIYPQVGHGGMDWRQAGVPAAFSQQEMQKRNLGTKSQLWINLHMPTLSQRCGELVPLEAGLLVESFTGMCGGRRHGSSFLPASSRYLVTTAFLLSRLQSLNPVLISSPGVILLLEFPMFLHMVQGGGNSHISFFLCLSLNLIHFEKNLT